MPRTEEEIERQRRFTRLNQEWRRVNSALLGRHRELTFDQQQQMKSRGLDLVAAVAAIRLPIGFADSVPSSADIKTLEDSIEEANVLSGRLDIILEAMQTDANGVNGHVSDSGEDAHAAAT